MKELLELYRDRLNDLTAKNKSLKLMRLTNKNHFDIHSLTEIDEGLELKVLEQVKSGKELIPLIPQYSLEEEGIIANRKLLALKREVDLIEQETGNNPFYISYGFLEGFLIPDFFIRCPILFYPAKLVRTIVKNMPYWALELGDDSVPFINRTFIMAIQKYVGGDISKSIQDELDSIPTEIAAIIPFLYELLRAHDISLTVETSNLTSSFRNMKVENIPQGKKGFTLQPYFVMGKFQQSTSTLLNDYNNLIEELPEGGFLNDLLNGSENENDEFDEIDAEELNRTHPSENFFVLDTDASQEAVIVAARNRKGLIVHGPPGTGKSQVIVNLIVDRMIRGEKVLLVCQKPAALDVVYNRLGQLNLQSNVALVHDFNRNKIDVYSKIAAVIEREMPNMGLDYNRLSNEKHALTEKLNKIAHSLHSERPFGKSLYYLYSNAKCDQNQIIEVEDVLKDLTFEDLQVHLIDLKTIIELMQKYDNLKYPLCHRKSFATFSVKHHLELKNVLDLLCQYVKNAFELKNNLQLRFNPIHYLENIHTLHDLEQTLDHLKNKNLYRHILKFFTDKDREYENEDHLDNIKQKYGLVNKQINFLNSRTSPEASLSVKDAETWKSKIIAFEDLNKKLTRFFNTNWYSLKKEIQEHCKEIGVNFDGNSVREYRDRIETFLLFEEIREETKKDEFFADIPMENKVDDWNTWIRFKEQAILFLISFTRAQTVFPKWLNKPINNEVLEQFCSESFLTEIKRIIQLADLMKDINKSINELSEYISEQKLKELVSKLNEGHYDVPYVEALLNSLDHFDSLCRLDQLKEEMGSFKKVLIERCNVKIPLESSTNVVGQWMNLIENSFLHTWILQIETIEPYVKDVSTEIYEKDLNRFSALLKERRKAVPPLVDNKLFKQSLEVNGAARQKLKNESNKKRKVLPLRQVVGHFFDDLLKLVPCWLCTPEAVSAIFPMNQDMFDLVIFDEASQCPVENAIPSIFRAKQLVIAGDEKQLPPSSFFQSSNDEEDEEEEENTAYVDRTDKQAKSLLEWGRTKFPDKWLTWHYRSDFEELINFSNYAFYDKRIQIAPTVTKSENAKPIEFIRVDGLWENQTNRVEAESTVDNVFGILKNDETKPTIGIITFNKKQTDLINDVFEERAANNPEVQVLLEKARVRKKGEENMGLFVKNIENVQGDERDIIIFSVGYAKDMGGKMVSQFGPLSRDGGENRLNVAISRAKKKVVIVCSFEPSEWTRVETYAKGVRLFKRYLEYGKAISDGNYELSQNVLNGLVDGTNVYEHNNQLLFDSPFEEEVCNELRAIGLEVHTQVGFSGYRIDLAILDPGTKERYILGVECDGATYHSSKVARERDLYRQRFLESKGWRIHRIWSRNWWLARGKELEKIKKMLEK